MQLEKISSYCFYERSSNKPVLNSPQIEQRDLFEHEVAKDGPNIKAFVSVLEYAGGYDFDSLRAAFSDAKSKTGKKVKAELADTGAVLLRGWLIQQTSQAE